MSAPDRELWTDGGVIGRNPSAIGVVWAWRQTWRDGLVREASGILRPADLGLAVASNNNAEMAALLYGLEEIPDGWTGRVNSDSRCALGWIAWGFKRDAIPGPLLRRLEALDASGKLLGLDFRLLQGHPTKDDLARGIGAKRRLPVSYQNVLCDEECRRLATEAVQ